MDYNTNAFTVTGMCQEAAIYGLDGSVWAWSPGFPELSLRLGRAGPKFLNQTGVLGF